MASHPQLSIVILYSHPLLGEGIGQMLAAEPGVEVSYVSCGHPAPLDAAAERQPHMLVVERCGCFDAPQLLDRFPDALVIDIGLGPGPTCVYRRQEIPGNPAAILRLVRRLRGGHPSVSLPEVDRSHEALTVSPS
jgi:DNA-binding NarL/FixJ family response regulator